MKGGYFLLNGRFYKENETVFTVADFAGRTTGFSEFFRAEHNEIIFPELIAGHLIATAETVGLDLTGLVDSQGRLLRKDVSRLLNKNHLYQAAKIEIQIFPANQQINLVLKAVEIAKGYYPVKEPGLLISFYRDQLKDIRPDIAYASFGLFIQQAAIRAAFEWNMPTMILLNKDGYACESIGGSVAYIDQDRVVFVSKNSGGYHCAIKNQVVRSVMATGFQPIEKESITPNDLLQAEELFLFDAVNGIQKVLGLEDRRYFSTKTGLIAKKLTQMAKEDRESKG